MIYQLEAIARGRAVRTSICRCSGSALPLCLTGDTQSSERGNCMPAVREHRVDRERILLVLQQERAHERQHLRKHEARDLLSRRHQQHFRSCEPETQDAAFRCAQARLAADCVSCDIGRGSHMSRDTNTTCCRYASGASGVESGAGAPLTAATAQGSASTRRTSAPPPAARHVGCHGRHLLRVRSHGSEVRSRAEGGGGSRG